jgi:hypothetical protein
MNDEKPEKDSPMSRRESAKKRREEEEKRWREEDERMRGLRKEPASEEHGPATSSAPEPVKWDWQLLDEERRAATPTKVVAINLTFGNIFSLALGFALANAVMFGVIWVIFLVVAGLPESGAGYR